MYKVRGDCMGKHEGYIIGVNIPFEPHLVGLGSRTEILVREIVGRILEWVGPWVVETGLNR